ncbi:MAG: SIMPL domain-containing protein [Patescibacteria group bacterium]
MFNQFFGEEEAKRMSKLIAISLMTLSLFLLVKVIEDFKRLPNVGREIYPQSTIMVSGSGEAYAIPDIATFNFSVVEIGDTVKQAQEKADAKINKALAAVRESGIEDKDIKTTGYNVYPKYEWSQRPCPLGISSNGMMYPCPAGKNILTGYEVNQTITVKVRDTEKAADLVTKIGAVGVENISNLEFSVDDREKYVAEARSEAIAEAKTKAKELAKQLGVKLGKIIYYNENGNYPIYYGMEGKGGGADMMTSSVAPARAELPQGETKITSEISITYEIK